MKSQIRAATTVDIPAIALNGLTVSLLLVLAGCTSLQGVPIGLTRPEKVNLSSGVLKTDLDTAMNLSDRYEDARNSALHYVFWSNAPFLPLGVAGAGAIYYKGSKDLIAGLGIAAGSLLATNTFINARGVAKAYQSGMDGLACVTTKLRVYEAGGPKVPDSEALKSDADKLELAIAAGSSALAGSLAASLAGPAAEGERTANPTVVSVLAGNEKALTQAIADAQATIDAARNEVGLFNRLPGYCADRIRDINSIVGSKISPSDVNYTSLLSSLSALTTQPAPPKGAAAAVAPAAPLVASLAAAKSGGSSSKMQKPASTALAVVAQRAKDTSDEIAALTKKLVAETTAFDLSTQERDIAACIKSL